MTWGGSYWVDWVKLSMCNLNQKYLVVVARVLVFEEDSVGGGFCHPTTELY